VVDSNRHLADVPFELREFTQVRQALGFGTLHEEIWKRSAIFGDAWSLWWILASKMFGGFR
jgi:hypothetical protein